MRLAVLVVVAAIGVGCAGSSASDSDPATKTTDLRISIRPGGPGTTATSWTVACTNTVEGAAADACSSLAKLGDDAFAPVPSNVACTEIYGGPEIAEVRGTFEGRKINATFSRTNGCEIARWDRHAFLFPVPS